MAKARYRNECKALGEGRMKQRRRKSFTYSLLESVVVRTCDCRIPFLEIKLACWKVANLHTIQESFQQGRYNDSYKSDMLTAGIDSIYPPTRFQGRLHVRFETPYPLLYQSPYPLVIRQQFLEDSIYALIVVPREVSTF